MKMQITNRFTGAVLFEGEYSSMREIVEAAVEAGANLACANLAGAKNAESAIARTRILPEGDLIGWKKCRNGVVVKLRIPADAKRSHAFGRKCRAEYADVLEVIGAEVGYSAWNESV